jgi:hypothetical protein
MDTHDQKNRLEVEKLIEEVIHLRKKNMWFEIITTIAILSAGIAIAKVFL